MIFRCSFYWVECGEKISCLSSTEVVISPVLHVSQQEKNAVQTNDKDATTPTVTRGRNFTHKTSSAFHVIYLCRCISPIANRSTLKRVNFLLLQAQIGEKRSEALYKIKPRASNAKDGSASKRCESGIRCLMCPRERISLTLPLPDPLEVRATVSKTLPKKKKKSKCYKDTGRALSSKMEIIHKLGRPG